MMIKIFTLFSLAIISLASPTSNTAVDRVTDLALDLDNRKCIPHRVPVVFVKKCSHQDCDIETNKMCFDHRVCGDDEHIPSPSPDYESQVCNGNPWHICPAPCNIDRADNIFLHTFDDLCPDNCKLIGGSLTFCVHDELGSIPDNDSIHFGTPAVCSLKLTDLPDYKEKGFCHTIPDVTAADCIQGTVNLLSHITEKCQLNVLMQDDHSVDGIKMRLCCAPQGNCRAIDTSSTVVISPGAMTTITNENKCDCLPEPNCCQRIPHQHVDFPDTNWEFEYDKGSCRGKCLPSPDGKLLRCTPKYKKLVSNNPFGFVSTAVESCDCISV